MTKRIAVYVDGNYVFHQAKGAGKTQDFEKIIKSIERICGGTVVIKRFYTRPPQDTNSSPVLNWLTNHGWATQWIPYAHTHQDSLYVPLIADVFADYQDSEDIDTIVILSGSGALSHPCSRLQVKPQIFTTEGSCNHRLRSSPSVEICNLLELL